MKQYNNIIAAVFGTVWAIMPEKLEAIIEFLSLKNNGVSFTAEEIESRINRRATSFKNVKGDISVLPLYGVISQKMNMMTDISGGMSTEMFGMALDEALADSSIGAVVIDVDSPGGSVFGVQELSNKIYSSRGKKPIIAVCNSLMASAAYWIGSAADEIVITPGGEIGSVGVVATHTDYSQAAEKQGVKTSLIHAGKYKVEGNPYEPLQDEARQELQARVDDYYNMFTSDVARNRGTNQSKVKAGYGEGRVVGAKAAIQKGMADRIGTLENVLTGLARKNKPSSKSSSYFENRLAMRKHQ